MLLAYMDFTLHAHDIFFTFFIQLSAAFALSFATGSNIMRGYLVAERSAAEANNEPVYTYYMYTWM